MLEVVVVIVFVFVVVSMLEKSVEELASDKPVFAVTAVVVAVVTLVVVSGVEFKQAEADEDAEEHAGDKGSGAKERFKEGDEAEEEEVQGEEAAAFGHKFPKNSFAPFRSPSAGIETVDEREIFLDRHRIVGTTNRPCTLENRLALNKGAKAAPSLTFLESCRTRWEPDLWFSRITI